MVTLSIFSSGQIDDKRGPTFLVHLRTKKGDKKDAPQFSVAFVSSLLTDKKLYHFEKNVKDKECGSFPYYWEFPLLHQVMG